jgi:hypothetical protein
LPGPSGTFVDGCSLGGLQPAERGDEGFLGYPTGCERKRKASSATLEIMAISGWSFHYRDSNGLEADAVTELPDGRWAAIEIELGSSPAVAEAAAANLLRLRGIIDGPAPVALGVITGTGYSLVPPDADIPP